MDLRSQEAYEMAVTGELGPQGKSPPILTGLRVSNFKPPFFTLGENRRHTTASALKGGGLLVLYFWFSLCHHLFVHIVIH